MIPQPAEKGHPSRSQRSFELAPGQAIDLNQEQARFLAGTFGNGQIQMANRPFVAAKSSAKAMPKRSKGCKHSDRAAVREPSAHRKPTMVAMTRFRKKTSVLIRNFLAVLRAPAGSNSRSVELWTIP